MNNRNQAATVAEMAPSRVPACWAKVQGADARRRGFEMDLNPFYMAHESAERRAWESGWFGEHVRIQRKENGVVHA